MVTEILCYDKYVFIYVENKKMYYMRMRSPLKKMFFGNFFGINWNYNFLLFGIYSQNNKYFKPQPTGKSFGDVIVDYKPIIFPFIVGI